MSVVVAIRENGKVYMGADSQVTKGGTRITLKNPNNYKIWKVKGVDNCLMAHVGNVREATVVRVMDDLISDYELYRGNIDFEFVVKKVVPRIVNELRDYDYLDSGVFNQMDSRFLFAYEDKLYLINSDGCVLEIDDCTVIGSGECEAVGSLLSTDTENPETRIVKAIKASAASDIYVDYPIVMTDTESTEFEIITENTEKEYINSKKKGSK